MIPASSLSSGSGGTCMRRTLHSFPEPYQCSIRGPAAIPYHTRAEHVGKCFTCPRCPSTYASKSGLTEHVRHIHENASRYRCDTCGKGFSIRSHYYDYDAIRTSIIRDYVCTKCMEEFTLNRHLKAHMLHFHSAETAQE